MWTMGATGIYVTCDIKQVQLHEVHHDEGPTGSHGAKGCKLLSSTSTICQAHTGGVARKACGRNTSMQARCLYLTN
jgi:hypothetical protein